MNNLSIIIPCYKDFNVANTIRSINSEGKKFNYKIEVVIVLTDPSKDLLELITILRKTYKSQFSIKIVESKNPKIQNNLYKSTPKGGLARAYNKGIKSAKYNTVLIMGSDVVFEKKCIENYLKNASKFDVIKGKVNFNKPFTFGNWITNQARKINTSEARELYTPSLLFKKSILKKLNEKHFYSEWVPYSCDSEFGDKIYEHNKKILKNTKVNEILGNDYGYITNINELPKQNKLLRINSDLISILFDDTAIVTHEPYTLKSDLRCAVKFGIDTYYFEKKKKVKTRFLKTLFFYFKESVKTLNPFIILYVIFWYLLQIASYFFEKAFGKNQINLN